jgi:hypothetical protein
VESSLLPEKNGFTPRKVAQFVLVEKPAHFSDPGDVLYRSAALMKCPAVQPESGTHCLRRMGMRSDVLNSSRAFAEKRAVKAISS